MAWEFDIWVCDWPGYPLQLTPETFFAIQPMPELVSRMEKQLAYISNQSGRRFNTFILPLAFSDKVEPAGKPLLVFDQSVLNLMEVRWSPMDGSSLARWLCDRALL